MMFLWESYGNKLISIGERHTQNSEKLSWNLKLLAPELIHLFSNLYV